MTQQELADRLAITDVLLTYAKGVDERELELYRSVFADDVEVVGFGEETVHGADAWREYVESALSRFGATQHMLGPPLIRVDGDVAHARTDVQALHYMKDAPDTTMTLWATYETDLARRGGTWKITRHELVPRGTRVQSDGE